MTPVTRPSLRQRISRFFNACLNRLGYAFVRLDDSSQQAVPAADVGYTYVNLHLLDVYAPWQTDRDFAAVWRQAASHTLTDVYRAYELYQCVREVSNLPGDVIEIGVWRGGTGALLAAAASRWKMTSKVWLCDTFAGVVKAGSHDNAYVGGEHADTSPEIVRSLLGSLKLDNARIVQGIFPDESAEQISEGPIALCHIDVDVYQSAADIIAWLMPRLSPGGMVVFDDYGFPTCPGITRLVDSLRDTGRWHFFYNLNRHAILTLR